MVPLSLIVVFLMSTSAPQWQYTNIRIFVVCILYNVGTTDNDQNDFISTMNRRCS